MNRLFNLRCLAALALVTGAALLVPPVFLPVQAQTGNAKLLNADLLDHPGGVGGNPPDVLSSCHGLTGFPANKGNAITTKFTGELEPCFNDIQFMGPNGHDDLCGSDDICLRGAEIIVGRDKTGTISSARLFLWDMDGNKYSTDVLYAYSDPPAPDGNACFTVHVDQTNIAVRPGEAVGKKQKDPVGSISWDDLRSCPKP